MARPTEKKQDRKNENEQQHIPLIQKSANVFTIGKVNTIVIHNASPGAHPYKLSVYPPSFKG